MSPDDPTTPGPRDHLITRALADALAGLGDDALDIEALDSADAPARLARHLGGAVSQALRILDEQTPPERSSQAQAQAVNAHLGTTDPSAEILLPPAVLRAIRAPAPAGGFAPAPPLPKTPMGQSDLLVNATDQPNIGSELRAEIATATRVDLLCAFVILSGVTPLEEALRAFVDRGGKLRVITTTYMGATQRAAVDRLVEIGAHVNVAFDAMSTKLHAKAWLLERPNGMTSAFVGSSNLSHTALFDGLEWNVRLAEADSPVLIDRIRKMFEAHWVDEHFERYDPARDSGARDRLEDALDRQKRRGGLRSVGGRVDTPFVALDVRPQPHQTRMLERLDVERQRHGRHRNLIVAATGTGKTVVAALDYRRLCASLGEGGRPSLLFLAHRDEILRQALGMYRHVLRDPNFGELHGSGKVANGSHVFGTIQTLTAAGRELPSADAFDIVVIDEFHHAEAPSYRRLIDHLEPAELLGLTATPERGDGVSVQDRYFGGRIAADLRLWEAIDEGFLVPFQYFGVGDDIDLSQVTWRRGDYDRAELESLYTADDARVKRVIRAMERVLPDISQARALGFCVGKEHAHFMAASFSKLGLPSKALTGDDPPELRQRVLAELGRGELRCVFSVDVLGEGVDVPSVDTVLLLRPTQSPVVFAQQLGRGLRTYDGKSHLTVIDLIGQQRREFRIDQRLGVLIDRRRGTVARQVEDEFPFLPAGCAIVLERQAREHVLSQLKALAQRAGVAAMVDDLRADGEDGDLDWFLRRTGRTVADLYKPQAASWTAVRRGAGRATAGVPGPDAAIEARLLRAMRRLRHVDDPARLAVYAGWLEEARAPRVAGLAERERRMLRMLLWTLWGRDLPRGGLEAAANETWRYGAVIDEVRQLLAVLDAGSTRLPHPSPLGLDVPLMVHARYATAEVIAALRPDALAPDAPHIPQAGVVYERTAGADLFFVTLKKSERDYSPTTMYRDYAITRELFHWESQASQHEGLDTVQRYIHHRRRETHPLLFVRETKQDEIGATTPFHFLGAVDYVSHEGERPVQFTWRLPRPMPEELFEVARSVAVA